MNKKSSSFRIVYVDVNVRYINQTREKFLEALSGCGEITMIGPGFSSGDSAVELQNLLSKPGAVDVVVTTSLIANGGRYKDMTSSAIASSYRKLFAYNFHESHFSELPHLNKVLTQSKKPCILITLQVDNYFIRQQNIVDFNSIADMIIGIGPECRVYKAALPNLPYELFVENATDCWADYLSKHADKISSMYHLVGDDEFCQTPLAQRKTKWSVLGVPYYARKVAIDRLKAAELSPLTTNTIRRLLAGFKKLKILSGEPNWYLDITQKRFQKALQSSCYSYTCGSGLETPIRKFFEIPAAGAVLVCRPFRGAEKCGFKDGKNFIACEPEDVVEVHHWLEANPEQAQQIATAGQMMVKKLHSVSARQEQIHQCLQATINKSGVGRWNDGCFNIITNKRDRQLHFPLAGAPDNKD